MDATQLRRISPEELERILESHDLYIDSGKSRGIRADLDDVDLEGHDFGRHRLAFANLRGANLRDVDLSGKFIVSADVAGANLRGTMLSKETALGLLCPAAWKVPQTLPAESRPKRLPSCKQIASRSLRSAPLRKMCVSR